MSRLVLIRHCEPQEDAHGRCYGSLDVGLSAAGRAHADELALRLGEVDAVWTSPRLRARETAAPIGSSPLVHDDLRELDFGELEGRTYDEIAASEPELYRAWMETPTRVRFPAGESFADLSRRAVPALERIQAQHEFAVVVTHGGVIRAGLAAWLGMPDERIFRLEIGYGGITVVDRLDGTPIIRMVNG
ncbi:MAG: histidine phosphatase family protein [Gaiellaceae bacterium]